MTSSAPLPLLEAVELRVDLGGAALLERTSLTSEGSRLALAGEMTAMMSALAGVATIRAGALRLLGRDVEKGEHLPIVGLAPLDPPLPKAWTTLEYLAHGARLAGAPKSNARQLAEEALSTIGAASLGKALLGALGLAERRVVVLAQAIVAKPEVLIASMPLANLDGAPASYVRRALERATRDRAFIVSLSSLDPGSAEYALAREADELLVFSGQGLSHRGSLEAFSEAGSSTYSLTVASRAEALRDRLHARGIDLRGGPREFWVQLAEGAEVAAILEASVEAEAAIVRLEAWR